MPSFDDPVEIVTRASRGLLVWLSLAHVLAAFGCALSVPYAAAAGLPWLGAVLGLAAAAFLVRIPLLWRDWCFRRGRQRRLLLDASGTLAGEDPATGPVQVTRISTLPGLVVLHAGVAVPPCRAGAAGAAGALLQRLAGQRCLYLARDGVDGTAWRRLHAWSRYGLPAAGRAGHGGGADGPARGKRRPFARTVPAGGSRVRCRPAADTFPAASRRTFRRAASQNPATGA